MSPAVLAPACPHLPYPPVPVAGRLAPPRTHHACPSLSLPPRGPPALPRHPHCLSFSPGSGLNSNTPLRRAHLERCPKHSPPCSLLPEPWPCRSPQPLSSHAYVPRLGFAVLDWVPQKQHLGEGNGTPLQYCCLENPMDGGA